MSGKRSAIGLVVFLAVTFLAAAIGSVFSVSAVPGWYQTLARPSWTPPDWVFGPVWTLLYAMMAVAAWLVWRRADGAAVTRPMGVYGVQLFLNAAWAVLFFGLHLTGTAMLDLVALWAMILVTTVVFWRRSPAAGALFLPYLAWVTYAGTLNLGFWWLNR